MNCLSCNRLISEEAQRCRRCGGLRRTFEQRMRQRKHGGHTAAASRMAIRFAARMPQMHVV